MTDRPIIFSAPMVRALLDGRKTMTRRLAWFDKKHVSFRELSFAERMALENHRCKITEPGDSRFHVDYPTPWQSVAVGDKLWVRETWMDMLCDPPIACYRADGEREHSALPWRPSIHMPRWASRLTLIVIETKIERLQDISERDAIAEGYQVMVTCPPKRWFSDLWKDLHGAESWDANPQVVAIRFTVEERNVDAPAKLLELANR